MPKIITFDGRENTGKYMVGSDGKSGFLFEPYSFLDGVASYSIQSAIQKKMDENKNNFEIKKEDFNSPSTMHREEIFIPAKHEYQFKITSTLTMNDSHSFSNNISLRNKEKGIGIDYNVLLGQYGTENKYFVQELKKVFGKHGNISANINTWAFCRSDLAISDEEKILVKQHFEDNIFQILSTTPQEIARKVSKMPEDF